MGAIIDRTNLNVMISYYDTISQSNNEEEVLKLYRGLKELTGAKDLSGLIEKMSGIIKSEQNRKDKLGYSVLLTGTDSINKVEEGLKKIHRFIKPISNSETSIFTSLYTRIFMRLFSFLPNIKRQMKEMTEKEVIIDSRLTKMENFLEGRIEKEYLKGAERRISYGKTEDDILINNLVNDTTFIKHAAKLMRELVKFSDEDPLEKMLFYGKGLDSIVDEFKIKLEQEGVQIPDGARCDIHLAMLIASKDLLSSAEIGAFKEWMYAKKGFDDIAFTEMEVKINFSDPKAAEKLKQYFSKMSFQTAEGRDFSKKLLLKMLYAKRNAKSNKEFEKMINECKNELSEASQTQALIRNTTIAHYLKGKKEKRYFQRANENICHSATTDDVFTNMLVNDDNFKMLATKLIRGLVEFPDDDPLMKMKFYIEGSESTKGFNRLLKDFTEKLENEGIKIPDAATMDMKLAMLFASRDKLSSYEIGAFKEWVEVEWGFDNEAFTSMNCKIEIEDDKYPKKLIHYIKTEMRFDTQKEMELGKLLIKIIHEAQREGKSNNEISALVDNFRLKLLPRAANTQALIQVAFEYSHQLAEG